MAGGFSNIAHFEDGGGGSLSSSWAVTWDQLNIRHKQDAAEMGKLAEFFNHTPGIDIGSCIPRNDLAFLSGGSIVLCLAEVGQSYYIWVDRGGTVSVDLSSFPRKLSVKRYRCTDLDNPVVLPDVVGGGVRNLGSTPTSGFGNDYMFVLTNVSPPGDFDADDDVDQADFGHLQACYSGAGQLYQPGCSDADLDHNNDVSQADYVIFQGCMSGEGVPANAGCAD